MLTLLLHGNLKAFGTSPMEAMGDRQDKWWVSHMIPTFKLTQQFQLFASTFSFQGYQEVYHKFNAQPQDWLSGWDLRHLLRGEAAPPSELTEPQAQQLGIKPKVNSSVRYLCTVHRLPDCTQQPCLTNRVLLSCFSFSKLRLELKAVLLQGSRETENKKKHSANETSAAWLYWPFWNLGISCSI